MEKDNIITKMTIAALTTNIAKKHICIYINIVIFLYNKTA